MRLYRLLCLIIFLLVASACNLSQQPPTDESIPLPDNQSGKPIVEISSPKSGDEFVVGTQIFVTAQASDTVGVTRVQLLANNQPVKTVSSESPAGQKSFDLLLDYTPRAQGAVALQIVAYRGAIASDPVEVDINIRATQTQVTATSQSVPDVPVIDPNDPTCRALINAGLNVRSGPGTVYDKLTVLGAGTVVPIIGRTGPNDWWQIRYGLTVGWVSAPFTSVYGICSAVPVVPTPPTPTPLGGAPTWTPQPTFTPRPQATNTPGTPDLVITSIAGATDVVLADAPTQTYSITVTNTGSGPSGTFVNVFTGADGVEVDLGTVSNLNAGESIVLTKSVTFTATGSFTLKARADSGNQVTEVSEVNNNASLVVSVT
ncbi:MAG: CARDB domain-containing protein [Chloroflexota bacterium]